MYIRTKDDEIYALESKEVSSYEYIDNDTARDIYGVDGAFYTIYYFDENKGRYSEYDDKCGHSCDFIEEKDILKQSENLEELGDWYVGIDVFGMAHFIEPKIPFENIKLCFKYMEINLAILTSKGLIYVAKMNDKGELELC